MLQGDREVYAELSLLEPGGDVRMRLGIHIGVYPNSHPGDRPHLSRHLIEQTQLLRGFHIEHEDVRLEGLLHLLTMLPHSGEHNPLGWYAGVERPEELSARDHVRPAAHRGEEPQD